MTDARRKVLRSAACVLVIVSLAIQIPFVAYYWWDFDPRLSCHRLQHWREWIDCLHGESHLYILLAEIIVLSWLVAGIVWLLARFLPPFISALVPGCLALALVWYAINNWHANVVPYAPFGETTFWDTLSFVTGFGIAAVYVVGPAIGTGYWGSVLAPIGGGQICRRLPDRQDLRKKSRIGGAAGHAFCGR